MATGYQNLLHTWQTEEARSWALYQQRQSSFVPHLPPSVALGLPIRQVLDVLQHRLGPEQLQQAMQPHHTVPSPVAAHTNSQWIKRTNMVGINVRTIGSFWRVIHYALSLPDSQSAVHLLPIWEPGVVASLYGMASWRINPAFFDPELAAQYPHLNTVEAQLKVVVNVLHAMGKTVGMDVIPHTDRYSEIVLANPAYFEWLRRYDDRIVDHRAELHLEVQNLIARWLFRLGPACTDTGFSPFQDELFGTHRTEAERLRILFGAPDDLAGRTRRRAELVDWLFREGYEPVPATMGPPYRGLEVDTSPEACTTDHEGRVWRDYRISQPQEMSRVFGPLTRYKFYDSLNDNQHWAIDFDSPRTEVWDYFCAGYAQVQQTYNLDFMRGDMSHVQMRPEGVPIQTDDYYDPHRAVKTYIGAQVPYFAYFAESFLAGPNYMAYGDEVEHLEASLADATLGDLQSMVVGEPDFMAHLRRYLDLQKNRRTTPCFTLMTGDKDDPRFDKFYLDGNEARLFFGLFVPDMPSYMALGFEQRDPHPLPAPNEHYTKLYVFQIDEGPKATHGPYQWGQNAALFSRINALRLQAELILPELANSTTHWLVPPDPTAAHGLAAWTQDTDARYLFVVNFDLNQTLHNAKVPIPAQWAHIPEATFRFSTHLNAADTRVLVHNDIHYQLPNLAPGEGMCFKLASD